MQTPSTVFSGFNAGPIVNIKSRRGGVNKPLRGLFEV